jgi:hypothetical protein
MSAFPEVDKQQDTQVTERSNVKYEPIPSKDDASHIKKGGVL